MVRRRAERTRRCCTSTQHSLTIRARAFRRDSSIFRPVPPDLRGVKPTTPEPWSRDAIIYMQKAGDFEEVLNDDEPYTDESPLDSTDPTEDKSINKYLTERPRKGKKAEAAKAWDGTTRRYCPHGLRGIKPVTREPWSIDEKYYNKNTTRKTLDAAQADHDEGIAEDNSFDIRAMLRQVTRPGFYMPNHEKWAALLSA